MFCTINVSPGLTSIFIGTLEASSDQSDAKAGVVAKRRKTVVATSLTTFIYFGFNFFMYLILTEELLWRAHAIASEVAASVIIPEVFRQKWERFVARIQRDKENICNELQVIYRGHCTSDRSQFLHYKTVNNNCYYIHSFGFHCNPKRTKFGSWRNTLLSYNSLHVDDSYVLDVPCNHETDYLLPFFGDNMFIEGYLYNHPNCKIKQDFLAAKMAARTSVLTDSPFSYKENFNDNVTLWHENLFSIRLASCLRKYPIVPAIMAQYTGREGQQFARQESSIFYLFHGSPDIAIKRIGGDARSCEDVIILDKDSENDAVTDETNDAGPSDETTGDHIAIIENKSNQVDTVMVHDVTIPEDISEVLANIHIVLVKNFLTSICKGNATTTTTVECRGVFLSKVLGACHCKMIMPVIDVDESNLLQVALASCMHGQLTKDNLCCHLNKLCA